LKFPFPNLSYPDKEVSNKSKATYCFYSFTNSKAFGMRNLKIMISSFINGYSLLRTSFICKTKMKKSAFLLLISIIFLSISGNSQTKVQVDTLLSISKRRASEYILKKFEAEEWAKKNGFPIKTVKNGSISEIQFIDEFGVPRYYTTDNRNSSATISTRNVNPGGSAGLNLTGAGITVREWDGGIVKATHTEFGGRAAVVDNADIEPHATHVAGIIMGAGIRWNARGMAYQANLRSFDWNSDESEMAAEAAAGALISNHSYGIKHGWSEGTWYGVPSISTQEDYSFGFYDDKPQGWDLIAWNAPYFLICKAAGNDRGQSGTGYPADGPYDCISDFGVAKNVMTIGAVDDITSGYSTSGGVTQVQAYFSSWGPVDDGRIKPDIVANGVALYSASTSFGTNAPTYEEKTGTSMASPSVAGSLALLQQHSYSLTGSYMLSATLKALAIHTADEAGPNIGPDYMFGWGLMNTKNAALKIIADQSYDVISEQTINNGEYYTRDVVALGTEPIKVTIVWTDPPGTPTAASLDPITPMLVNDLDLRLTSLNSTYYPWKLNRDNPTFAATNFSKNNVDNVEVVYIPNPVQGATYTITVDHDGTLQDGSQNFSIIISGVLPTVHPIIDFAASSTNPAVNTQVNFTDNSINVPTSWNWSFSPSTVTYLSGSTSTSKNPQVKFTAPGLYTVTLKAYNAFGSDSVSRIDYVNVSDCVYNTLPFIENFSNATLPACWSIADNIGSSQVWQFGTISTGYPNPSLTGNYAFLNSYAYGAGNSQNTDLITPCLDLSAYSTVNLQFTYYNKYQTSNSGKLYYSLNNGITWVLIATFSTTAANNPYVFSKVLLYVGGQSQVKFKWNFTGTYGYYWAIDDVQITSCPSLSPVGVSVSTNVNPICSTNTVVFTATPSNAGPNPIYQWRKNGVNQGTGSSSPTYGFSYLNNNDVISCVLTSNAACISGNPATSNAYTVTVGTLATVGVAISASANPVEIGTMVTYTATPANGGTNPVYQWKVNGINSGTNSPIFTYMPMDNDVISCVLTSNILCAFSNPATSPELLMTVNHYATTLTVSAFPEGLFNGTGLNKAQNGSGFQFPGDVSDQITLELHSSIAPYGQVGNSVVVNLNTLGSATFELPVTLSGLFYLVIKHRNSIETWSAVPILIGTGIATYDFTDMQTRAFGSTLKPSNGKFVFPTGDVNQDGVMDALDLIAIDNLASGFESGYVPEDLNGDGVVNALDIVILINNISGFVIGIKP